MTDIRNKEKYIMDMPDNLPGGIIVSRCSDHKIVYANRKIIEMLECEDFDDLLAYTGGIFRSVMHEEDRLRMDANISQQFSVYGDTTDHMEYRIVTKSGAILYVQDYAYKKQNQGEDLFYIFVVELGRKLLAYDVDELTDLPKQHRFLAYAEQFHKICEDTGTNPAYVYLDLSNFKMFNLNFGTEMGDRMLRQIAQILQEEFADDFVSRSSGDHFVVLTEQEHVEERTRKAVARIDALQKRANVYARVGISFLEKPLLTPTEGLNLAREACTSIRKESKEHIRMYSQENARHLRIKAYVTEFIDDAIEKREITVFYQPVIRTLSRALCGFEALARWNNPVYGFLSPADFIPALENSSQIHKLDCYVLEEICRLYQIRQREGKRPVPISFNLSRLDFQMLDIVSFVIETADKYEVPHDMLRVEITETTLASEDEQIKEAIDKFHEAGFAVWMDDFGSGYSSLNSLKDYNFDKLKIDMKFLSIFNERSRSIITSIVLMAKSIGIHTLAEGVESAEQYEFLRNIGCEEVQGYLFGKPLPMHASLMQVFEKGIEPETREDAAYYGSAGATIFNPEDPFLILEDHEDILRAIFMTKKCLSVLHHASKDYTEEALRHLNNPKESYKAAFREKLEEAEASGGYIHFAFPYRNNYMTMGLQVLSHKVGHRLLKVNLSDSIIEMPYEEKTIKKTEEESGENSGYTLLLVDDEPVNLMLLGEMLNPYYSIQYAENGEKALQMIRENPGEISAVLLDMVMPGMGGMEVLGRIRENESTRLLPVIAMTSATYLQEELLTKGASQFLPKPFEAPEIIRAKIQNVISRTNNLRDLAYKTMEFLPGGVFVYKAEGEGEIVYANRRCQEIFECGSMEEFMELTGGTFQGLVLAEDYPEVEKQIWEQIDSGDDDHDHVFYRIRTKTGKVVHIDDFGHLVEDAIHGRVFYVFIGENRDI